MNKITIPTLLLGVVMIAGAFAFMPVQEASTVHTSVTGASDQIKVITAAAVDGTVITGGTSTTLTCATGCIVNGITITFVDSNNDEEINIAVDAILIDGQAIESEIFNMVAGTALVDVNLHTSITAVMNIADAETEAQPPFYVENDLVIPWLAIAGTWNAADSLTVKFLIEEGADNTATAVTAG